MISVIVPVYNEEKSLHLLISRISKSLSKITDSYEIIVVDDGSTDNTCKELVLLKNHHNSLKIISFQSNLGQTAAIERGFAKAAGDIIVTLDGDLQNYPEDIPLLVKKLTLGYDVVCGWRKDRKDPFFSKNLPSIFSNTLLRTFAGSKVHDAGCSIRAYKKHTVKGLHMFGEMHRFIPVILSRMRYKVTEIVVRHDKRAHSKTKYGKERYVRGFLDLVFLLVFLRYIKRPFHIFGFIGLLCMFFGFVILAADLIYLLFVLNIPLHGLNLGPMLFLAIMFILFGINFIVLGLISEIMYRPSSIDSKETEY